MTTKCIKLAIDYSNDNTLDKKKFFEILRDIQYKTYLACNRGMTYYYTNDMQGMLQKDIGLPTQSDKDIFGKSIRTFVYDKMSEIFEGDYSSEIFNTANAFTEKRYKNDKKELLKGNVSLSRFKRDIPVMTQGRTYEIVETPKGLGFTIRLFSTQGKHKYNVDKILFTFPKIDASSKSILRRMMDKTYKQGVIQINYNKRKKKWMVAMSYTFENNKTTKLKDDLVMGIDLGITQIATMSILDVNKEEYIRINWKDRSIDGKELIHYRQKIEARRKELSIASKWASENNTGRGYKAKTELTNSIGDKYSRFKDTYNHKVSRYIVDMAVKYEVSCIQMEDLSGFSEYQTESLLKNWSYYDLQNKIKYKAEEKGISVVLVNPQYTSKRCSRCGNIHSDNRNCKENQSKFECVVCGHNENADINASKNIAIPNIEQIIKDYIKENKVA